MYKQGMTCAKCDCLLDHKNNKPQSYTTHHIYPQKFFKGIEPTEVLCRTCHNEADSAIDIAGGMDRQLTKEEYWTIYKKWFYKQTEE